MSEKPTSLQGLTINVGKTVVLVAGAIFIAWLKNSSPSNIDEGVLFWILRVSEITLFVYFLVELVQAMRFFVREFSNFTRYTAPKISKSATVVSNFLAPTSIHNSSQTRIQFKSGLVPVLSYIGVSGIVASISLLILDTNGISPAFLVVLTGSFALLIVIAYMMHSIHQHQQQLEEERNRFQKQKDKVRIWEKRRQDELVEWIAQNQAKLSELSENFEGERLKQAILEQMAQDQISMVQGLKRIWAPTDNLIRFSVNDLEVNMQIDILHLRIKRPILVVTSVILATIAFFTIMLRNIDMIGWLQKYTLVDYILAILGTIIILYTSGNLIRIVKRPRPSVYELC